MHARPHTGAAHCCSEARRTPYRTMDTVAPAVSFVRQDAQRRRRQHAATAHARPDNRQPCSIVAVREARSTVTFAPSNPRLSTWPAWLNGASGRPTDTA